MKDKYEQALSAYRKGVQEYDGLLVEFKTAISKNDGDDAGRFRLLNALLSAILSEYDNDGARAAILSACENNDEIVDAFEDAFGDSCGALLRKHDWEQRGDGIRDVMAKTLQNLRNR